MGPPGTHRVVHFALFALALVGLVGLVLARTAPVQAGGVVGSGTPQSCTAKALADAMSTGGLVTFNCGPAPTSILITQSGGIAINGAAVTVDGADRITLSGGNTTRVFYLASGALTLTHLLVSNGYGGSSLGYGGCLLVSTGTLLLNNVSVQNCSTDSGFQGGAIATFNGPVTLVSSRVDGNQSGNGGGLYTDAAPLTLVGSQVNDNTAANGGGIYSTGALTLVSTIIAGNSANTTGGGIDLEGGSALIDHGSIYSNTTKTTEGAIGNGGGLNNANAAQATIQSSQVYANRAIVGGGILNWGTLSVTQSTLSGNAAEEGGGIANRGTLTLTNATLGANSALLLNGGGIYNLGTATLTNVTLSGNSAFNGGGIYNYSLATFMLNTSTLSGNSANNLGGGISNLGSATLTNVTLNLNSATRGGGIGHDGVNGGDTFTLKNTIVANSPVGGNCYTASVSVTPLASNGFNFSSDNSCTPSFTQPGDQTNTPAQLGPLANNGGSTFTHLPLPPITMGVGPIDNGHCPNGSLDQRGVLRPQGAACDIGAVEYRMGETTPWLWLPLIRR